MKQLVAMSENRVNGSDVDTDWNIMIYSKESTEPSAQPSGSLLAQTPQKNLFLSEVIFSSWLFFNVELLLQFYFFLYIYIYILLK